MDYNVTRCTHGATRSNPSKRGLDRHVNLAAGFHELRGLFFHPLLGEFAQFHRPQRSGIGRGAANQKGKHPATNLEPPASHEALRGPAQNQRKGFFREEGDDDEFGLFLYLAASNQESDYSVAQADVIPG